MGLSITKRNYLLQTTLLTLLVEGIGGWAYYTVFPNYYFSGYPLVPAYFYLLGLLIITLADTYRCRKPTRLLQVYLLVRGMRMFVSVLVLVVFCALYSEAAAKILLTFVINYIIYLVYDSWFFSTYGRNEKKKGMKNEMVV